MGVRGWMSEEDHFPDERVLSGIIFINRNGLRWRVAPVEYGPPKTLYNRWVRCGRLGVFARMLTEMAAEGQNTETVMIDATHLKAHRTASSLRGKSAGQKEGANASSVARQAIAGNRREGGARRAG